MSLPYPIFKQHDMRPSLSPIVPEGHIYYKFSRGRHLLCEGYRTNLPDNSDLYLTRIGHLVLNLLSDLRAELGALLIAHLVGTNNDAQLTSGLNGIGLRHAGIAHGDCLKVVQTFDVSLDDLTAGTGTRSEMASHTCTIGASSVCISTSSWWAAMAFTISGFSLYFSAIFPP